MAIAKRCLRVYLLLRSLLPCDLARRSLQYCNRSCRGWPPFDSVVLAPWPAIRSSGTPLADVLRLLDSRHILRVMNRSAGAAPFRLLSLTSFSRL